MPSCVIAHAALNKHTNTLGLVMVERPASVAH